MRTLLLFIAIDCSLLAQHIDSVRSVSVRWSDTPALLGNQTAIARAASGATLEGQWRSVTPTTFTMFVRKSHDGPAQRGRVTMNRDDLETLSFRPVRVKGRVAGPLIGALPGALIGGSFGGTMEAVRAGEAAAMVIGYAVGRIHDRAPVSVFILPDDAPPQPSEPRRSIPSFPGRLLLKDAMCQEPSTQFTNPVGLAVGHE